MASASQRALGKIEQIAAERYGAAAAVSIDRDEPGFVVRIWSAAGEVVLATPPTHTRAAAIATMRRVL